MSFRALAISGFEISTRPLANASVKPFGQVEIINYSPGLVSEIFISRKIKLYVSK